MTFSIFRVRRFLRQRIFAIPVKLVLAKARSGNPDLSLCKYGNPERGIQVERALQQIESEKPGGIEKLLSDLMESFL
jgi:hypothetical protein